MRKSQVDSSVSGLSNWMAFVDTNKRWEEKVVGWRKDEEGVCKVQHGGLMTLGEFFIRLGDLVSRAERRFGKSAVIECRRCGNDRIGKPNTADDDDHDNF